MEFLIVSVDTNQSYMQHIIKPRKAFETVPMEMFLNGFKENLQMQSYIGERCRLQMLTLVLFYQLLVQRENKLI